MSFAPTPQTERFAHSLATSVPPPLRGWADDRALEAGALDFLRPLWERLDDQALAEEFFRYCPIAGACAADYRTRTLTLEGHGPVWAGIRFKGGDLALPFIEVATPFSLGADAIAALGRLLSTEFAVFRPRALRVWRFEPDGPPPCPKAVLDQSYYAAPIARVQAKAPGGSAPGLEVVRASQLDWYDTLAADHAAFLASQPRLAGEVRFETREDLAACLEAGLLFEARVAGTIAGVIAFEEAPFFGLPGYLVVEEFLGAHFRGRGLGRWLQWLAAGQLSEDRLLVGTIHALNVPSRRTAEANGRLPILSSYFVPLPTAWK